MTGGSALPPREGAAVAGAAERPSGTVTFLFTDIEGSTRLLDELGERYDDVLAEHHRLLRGVWNRHRGVEVDTAGDAFFVAFADARDAVAAAAEAQLALAPTGLRVRIGVHTGEGRLRETGYVGMDVHRGARIAAAAHGGQIVLSAATRALVEPALEVRDLGPHRLKDLARPERLFQVGAGDFPPLRTLNATNLPVQPSPLVGRERELRELTALVLDARLVTVTGPGGTGKTRLSLQAAAEVVDAFVDGVFWVPLASVSDAGLVESTIAAVLGAKVALAEAVAEKRMLLLLDNFEQVVDAAPRLSELLARCPNVRLLVTSRALLRIGGEREYGVDPLSERDAVALFADRAVTSEPAEAVAEICRRLDGLPLAIELAAARTRVLPPERLLERLSRRLPLLTHGDRDAPQRQRTLRATIEWSYDLLPPRQRTLFGRLAVFAGSFDLEVAEEVADAELDDLEGLVEQSLVRRWGSGRLGMLETIRELATEKLDASPDSEAWRARHAEWVAALLEEADPGLYGPAQGEWLERLEQEQDELRRALAVAEALPDETLRLRLLASAWYFWYLHGDLAEAKARLEAAQPALAGAEPRLEALVFAGLALARAFTGDPDGAREPAEAAVRVARTLPPGRPMLRALSVGATTALAAFDLERSDELWRELRARADEAGIVWFKALALANLAVPHFVGADFARAAATVREALAAAEEAGDEYLVAANLANLGFAELLEGDEEAAVESWRRGLRRSRRAKVPEVVVRCADGLAAVAARRSKPVEAATLVGAVDAVMRRSHYELQGLERDRRRETLSTLETMLGAAALGEARAAGEKLAPDEAVEYALDVDLGP